VEVMEMVLEMKKSGLLVSSRRRRRRRRRRRGIRSTTCRMLLRVLGDNHEYMGRVHLNYGKKYTRSLN
jgi:hypothetical protein